MEKRFQDLKDKIDCHTLYYLTYKICIELRDFLVSKIYITLILSYFEWKLSTQFITYTYLSNVSYMSSLYIKIDK